MHYRKLREQLSACPASPLPLRSECWWKGADGLHLAALRAAFTSEEAEVLELRFARRLSDVDVAHVVGREPSAVRAQIERGVARATALLGTAPPSLDGTVEGALLEAFALDPATTPAPRRVRREPVLPIGSVVAQRYEVRALLGAGAFADVYEARDCEVTGHVVALKILRARSADARSIGAALRELQHIASVFHPSVVQLKDHGWHDEHLWFVMPLYRGETLATRLVRGPLSRVEAREIFEQLAEALASMHRAGVRHQDIKPENVFLATLDRDHGAGEPRTSGPRVLPVLLDLGVAAKDAELVLAGTPAYFAPEVAARFAHVPDPPPVGPKADVFSLALTLLHALHPRPQDQVPAGAVDAFIGHRAIHPPPVPSSAALADLRPCFERWLAVSPDERPTAERLRDELCALTRPAERRARLQSTVRWVVPVGAVVLAVFFAVVTDLRRQAHVSREAAARAGVEAELARARAHSISQSLSESAARRAELEANVARLEEEYQTSRMTREQLASRLARADGELTLLTERERVQSARARQQVDAIATLERAQAEQRRRAEATEAQLAEASEALQRERARVADATRQAEQLGAARDELAASERRRASLEARVRELENFYRGTDLPVLDAPAP
ncbi:MAG: protein kinase [Polyangiales bacterium]|nr:protein kinase [Myxococcales bacterium]MCB9661797.1 protein kinase [Sandaracinaceae bacterium]